MERLDFLNLVNEHDLLLEEGKKTMKIIFQKEYALIKEKKWKIQ